MFVFNRSLRPGGGFLNAQVLNLHEPFIGAAIGILPLVIIFLILQRYIVEGYKQSGLKG